ncbi:MAG: hypothetical protein H6806_01805 [Planctomycetes bacterium]|nr:hypothetical protein [Planctomycetota bacterium]MCB9824253.1 hypothetical protein [Planctomycetota bacterium]MCB9828484.1 hypothetical protein [Planctomycetota bacterium]MCB9900251.1 hypothetical protein [Planctomycetota bacterium]
MTRTRFSFAAVFVALLALSGTRGALADAAADKAAEEAAKAEAKALAERLGDKERTVREEALEAAKANQHALVTAAVVKRLGDEYFELRETAIEILAAREAEACKRAAALGLGARLAKLPGSDRQEERLLVIDGLRRLAQVSTLKALADAIDIKMDAEELGARTMAIANVPDAKAIELLIDLRSRAGRHAANGANHSATLLRKALTSAIGQDLGGDTDAWRIWWKDHKKDFDFEAAAERRRAAEEKADKREAQREERKEKRKKKRDGEGDGGSSSD